MDQWRPWNLWYNIYFLLLFVIWGFVYIRDLWCIFSLMLIVVSWWGDHMRDQGPQHTSLLWRHNYWFIHNGSFIHGSLMPLQKPQQQISIIGTMDQLRPRNLWYNKRILFLFVSWVFFNMRDQVLQFTRILGIWNGQWIRIGWFICSSLQFLWRKLRFQISMHQFSMCQISTLGINYDQWQPQNPLMQHHFSVEGWQLGSYLY